MELKDVILSTLAEMEESQALKPTPSPKYEVKETLALSEVAKKEPLQGRVQDTSAEAKSDNIKVSRINFFIITL